VLAPGTTIDRYELVCPIGEGGMAEVWVARQRGKHGFAKLFALKAIHHKYADDPEFHRMFLDEARIAAAIEHVNVAQVFDLGESGTTLYLVMEYVDGESLGAILSSIGKRSSAPALVPTAVAMRIVADVCAGLNAAHKLTGDAGTVRGIVHRDVSPQNILLSVKGDAKLIDFGIAVAADRVGGDTTGGWVKGKLHYMAPEQALREKLGAYTDVFSAGAVLYRMLAGAPPFRADNDAATLNLILSGAAPPPLPQNVSPLVSAIVERALSHDVGDRYASAAEMATALEAAMVEEGYVADVGTWVQQNLSDRYKERKEQLATRAQKTTEPLGSMAQDLPKPAAPAPEVPDLDVRPARPAPPPAAPPPVPAIATAPTIVATTKPMPKRPGPPKAEEIVRFDAGYTEPEPPPPMAENSPGFMDIRALAQRGAAPPGAIVPPTQHVELDDEPSSQAAPKIELAAQPREKEAKAPKRGIAGAGAWIKVAVAIVVIILLVAGALLLVPMIVKDRIISTARGMGIELTIDKIGLGWSNVTMRGVTARSASLPGVDVKVQEVFSDTWQGKNIRVTGAELRLDGNAKELMTSSFSFYEQRRAKLGGSAAEPRHVSVAGARVSWDKPFGEGTHVEASDVGIELDSKDTDVLRTNVGRFEVKTKRTTFGPWTGEYESDANGGSRIRLVLDPALPDGPSVLYVWGKAVTPKLTIHIPREPLANLGIKPADLGLPADPGTELEVKVEGGLAPSTRIEGLGNIDVYGVRVKQWKQPVDIHIGGGVTAPPGKPLELDHTVATIGPFQTLVAGTITPRDDGLRVDATWRTQPIPCDKLVKAEAKSLGSFVDTLHDLVKATGAVKVTGTAYGAGLLKWDSDVPDDATFTVTAKESCGMTLFGM
jgi:serine/threonine-protein kinase